MHLKNKWQNKAHSCKSSKKRLISLFAHLCHLWRESSTTDRYNAQYAPIVVEHFNRAHDRFLLIDDEVYHIGASLKDLGKRWFAFTLMHDLTAVELICKINERI